jgi:hypothetical protein
MYSVVYALVVFAGLAMTVREGLWSNSLTLFNILISGLVAFGTYSSFVTWLDVQLDGEFTYALDFVIVWALFVMTMIILRGITRAASTTRMRFRHPIDPVGGPLVGLVAAWTLAGFVTATLHMAPLSKEAFGGALVYSTTSDIEDTSALTSPHLGWLRLVRRLSHPASLGTNGTDRFNVAEFVKSYEDHRGKFEGATTSWLRVKRG